MIGRDEGVLTCVCGRHSGPPELCRLLPCLKCDRSYFEQTEKSKRFPAVAASHRQTLPVVSRQTHECGLLPAEPHSVCSVSLMFQHQLWMRQTRPKLRWHWHLEIDWRMCRHGDGFVLHSASSLSFSPSDCPNIASVNTVHTTKKISTTRLFGQGPVPKETS